MYTIAPCAIWVMGVMGYRGYGVQGGMGTGGIGTWAIDTFLPITPLILDGFLTKILLDIDINVFYLNTGRFFHDGFI